MKPNRNNYASYNNYWYAMRTYRARLGGAEPEPEPEPEPERPQQIIETITDFGVWSAGAQRGDLPEYLNEEWLWYGVSSDASVNEIILEVEVPVIPEGYILKSSALKTRTAPAETYRIGGWTEVWAEFRDFDTPLEAYRVLDGSFPYAAGYMPYEGDTPLSLYFRFEPDVAEGTNGYLILMEYTSIMNIDYPAVPGPTMRFNNDFYIEHVFELPTAPVIPDPGDDDEDLWG